MKPTVMLIEDDEADANAYKESIEEYLDVIVSVLHPLPRLIQDLISQVSRTSPSAIIIDQRLPVHSDAEYNGIDVIDHLRSIDINVPIVVLTNFPDDPNLLDRQFLTDTIWNKRQFDEDAKIYLERFARWIGGLQIKRDSLEETIENVELQISNSLRESTEITEDIVRLIAAHHFLSEPGLELVVWIMSDAKDEIRLIEVNTTTTPTGFVDVFSIPPSDLLPIKMKIADVTPSEWAEIGAGEIELPPGWSLDGSCRFAIEVVNEILS